MQHENINKLKARFEDLTILIRDLGKSIEKVDSGEKVLIGVSYSMVAFVNNETIKKCLEALLEEATYELEPIKARLKILDELAAETIKNKGEK